MDRGKMIGAAPLRDTAAPEVLNALAGEASQGAQQAHLPTDREHLVPFKTEARTYMPQIVTESFEEFQIVEADYPGEVWLYAITDNEENTACVEFSFEQARMIAEQITTLCDLLEEEQGKTQIGK